MARLWTSGWETGTYESNGGQYGAGGSTTSVQSTYKRTGTYALSCSKNSGDAYVTQIIGDIAELFFRFAYYHNDAGSGDGTNTKLIGFYESGSEHVSIGMTSDTLLLRLTVNGSTVDTGSVVISQSTWYVIEGHCVFANSGGSVTVKVNGTTDLSYTGDTCATANEFANSIRLGMQGGVFLKGYFFDDVAVNDTTGSYQNSWVGLGGVFWLEPTADGDQNDWTPSSGTVNYAMVDDIPPDNATTFNQALATNSIDLYEVDDCPQYIDVVNLVQVAYRASLVTSGYNELTDLVKVSGTVYSGTAHTIVPITPSFAYYLGTIHYLNPATGTVWGTAEVNAMQAGIEITV